MEQSYKKSPSKPPTLEFDVFYYLLILTSCTLKLYLMVYKTNEQLSVLFLSFFLSLMFVYIDS